MKTKSESLQHQNPIDRNRFMEKLRDIAVEAGAWILSAGFLTGMVWLVASVINTLNHSN